MKTYESECRALMEETMRRREPILKKQQEYYQKHAYRGLDGDPFQDELKAVTERFNKKLKKIGKKYGREIK